MSSGLNICSRPVPVRQFLVRKTFYHETSFANKRFPFNSLFIFQGFHKEFFTQRERFIDRLKREGIGQINETDSRECFVDFVGALLAVNVTAVDERREIDNRNSDFFRVEIFPAGSRRHGLIGILDVCMGLYHLLEICGRGVFPISSK
jgi:hypothetical protein